MNGTEGISVKVITRTEGISVRVIRMLSQLVGFGSIERASVKSDVFFDFSRRNVNEVDCELSKSRFLLY